jgi:hypothetical protein
MDYPDISRSRRASCENEIYRIKHSANLQSLDGGQETSKITIPSTQTLPYGRDFIEAIGCVAYIGKSDSPDNPHLMAIQVAIKVGPNSAKGLPPSASIQSQRLIPAD